MFHTHVELISLFVYNLLIHSKAIFHELLIEFLFFSLSLLEIASIGCDWLHEINISIRATREVSNISNERIQRLAMLESNILLKNLLQITATNSNALMQNLALDILNWILAIRLARYRCPKNYASIDINGQQSFCVGAVEEKLKELIQSCIILNNRTMAHKCVKMILTTVHGAQNMIDQKQCYSFEVALKNSILALIPDIINTTYAGALRWFTLLISATSNCETQGPISIAIIKLLIEILNEISKRSNNLNSILQSRFGLYGFPFESELFDTELPAFSKNGNGMPYSNVFMPKPNASGTQQQQQQQNHFSDLKNFCASDNSDLRVPYHLRRKSINNHIKGLLEVEPLHFVCCSTSEATRIENMDSLAMQATNVIDDIVIETPQVGFGTSKLATSEHLIKMPNEKITLMNETELEKKMDATYALAKNVVDKIFYSQMKKNKYKDTYMKGMSNTNMPIFTGDEEYMIIQQGDDKNLPMDIDSSRAQNGSSIYNNKVREFIEETNRDDSSAAVFPWHKLLSTPTKQMIIVDRMHSGARRQVTMDFGYPILLTDIIIPACSDLASLTIDVWCFDEEGDCVRLAVSQDIGVKALILSDLQPAPVCRYLKITFMGRYGMSATRCKIPMGSFYGHVVILDQDSYSDPVMKFVKNKKNNLKNQLKVLNALYEDTHCRYCLSSSKLTELLQPLLKNDSSNMSHMQSYLNHIKETEDSQEYSKISTVYDECISLQNQLNVIKNVIRRLENSMDENPQVVAETSLKQLCTDKLRVLSECLVETLLHFSTTYGSQNVAAVHNFFDLDTCNLMFKTLVINGDSHIRIATCSMLVKMCSYSLKPWWGTFFSDTFTTLFSSQNVEIFPQDR
jgi:baculoviral IAP repeat-containing protein 6